jgi:hypothetical protein
MVTPTECYHHPVVKQAHVSLDIDARIGLDGGFLPTLRRTNAEPRTRGVPRRRRAEFWVYERLCSFPKRRVARSIPMLPDGSGRVQLGSAAGSAKMDYAGQLVDRPQLLHRPQAIASILRCASESAVSSNLAGRTRFRLERLRRHH